MLESCCVGGSYILVHQAGLANPAVAEDDNLPLVSTCLICRHRALVP